MPGFLSRMFRRRTASVEGVSGTGGGKATKNLNRSVTSVNGNAQLSRIDAWEKTNVRREDVVELLKACCDELKARGLDTPLFLLPFRPSSDLSSTRNFIRRFFDRGGPSLRGSALTQELRLTDVLVIAGILRWVWSRLEGGIVGWEIYDLFAKAERGIKRVLFLLIRDSGYARDAFNVLMPLSVGSELHTAIILDFFGFLASVSAHEKSNGFSGSRLARMVGWYTFGIRASAGGFVDGYANWEKAAKATEHLFLAYLRSIAPTKGQISAALPLSLTTLLEQTSYPPRAIASTPIAPGATSILRITLSVRNISPTPFALLERLARHSFVQTNPDERGDALEAILDAQSTYNDPTKALTPECVRVLRLISATNESDELTAAFLRTPHSLGDKTWTRFADFGFEALDEGNESDDESEMARSLGPDSLRPHATRPRDFLGGLSRPKTPSWGDFLVSGFAPSGGNSGGFSLPPDKLLPPINTGSAHRSSSRDGPVFRSNLHELEKGEVKSVERSRVDDALWSVWIESLCGEEVEEKKAVFGRCVVAETLALDSGRRWIVIEELVKGADITPEPVPQVKGKKTLSKKQKKVQEDEQKRAQQRRSVSDLGVHKTEQGSLMARDARAQALAKKSATLRTIQERGPNDFLVPPPARRPSVEYNGRPSIMLGAEVTRAMKWAEGNFEYREDKSDRRNGEKPRPPPVAKPIPKPYVLPTPRSPPIVKPQTPSPPVQIDFPAHAKLELDTPKEQPVVPSQPAPQNEIIQEIPREPKVLPKVHVPRSKSPEPRVKSPEPPAQGPVLLPADPKPSYLKPPEKSQVQPSKFKKLFGSNKSRDEKDAKRASRSMSPMPPSPTTAQAQAIEYLNSTKPSEPKELPPARSPSPIPPVTAIKEWEEEFDGTHRTDSMTTKPPPVAEPFPKPSQPPAFKPSQSPPFKPTQIPPPSKPADVEPYVPATPPTIPIVRAETPERKSEDDSLDRWAQIRKNAAQRALTRNVAPARNGSSDEIAGVDVPRVRQVTLGDSPKRKVLKPEEEDEESVDARVARIRKRVQELTAGMGDDDD